MHIHFFCQILNHLGSYSCIIYLSCFCFMYFFTLYLFLYVSVFVEKFYGRFCWDCNRKVTSCGKGYSAQSNSSFELLYYLIVFFIRKFFSKSETNVVNIQVSNEAEHCLTIVLSQYDPFRCLSVCGPKPIVHKFIKK